MREQSQNEEKYHHLATMHSPPFPLPFPSSPHFFIKLSILLTSFQECMMGGGGGNMANLGCAKPNTCMLKGIEQNKTDRCPGNICYYINKFVRFETKVT